MMVRIIRNLQDAGTPLAMLGTTSNRILLIAEIINYSLDMYVVLIMRL